MTLTRPLQSPAAAALAAKAEAGCAAAAAAAVAEGTVLPCTARCTHLRAAAAAAVAHGCGAASSAPAALTGGAVPERAPPELFLVLCFGRLEKEGVTKKTLQDGLH